MKLRVTLFGTLWLASASPAAQTPARHVADFERGGLLSMPRGSPPEMTAVAGVRFHDLVPDSKQEVCYQLLFNHAQTVKGLHRLRVVDADGKDMWLCTL